MLLSLYRDPQNLREPSSAMRTWQLPGAAGWTLAYDPRPIWRILGDWRKLVAAIGLIVVLLYLCCATLAHAYLDRQPDNTVTWSDIALVPFRWQEIRRKQGDTAIRRGLDQIQRSAFGEAFFNLRVGVSRSPGNVPGRIALAQFYAPFTPRHTLDLLQGGLLLAPQDEALLRAFFVFLKAQLAPDYLATRAREMSAQAAGAPPSVRRLIACAHADALLDLGRADEALAVLDAAPVGADRTEELRLRIAALTALGNKPAAEAAWAELERLPLPPAEAARLAAEFALSHRDDDALADALRHFRLQLPESDEPLLFAIRAWHLRKRITLRDAAEADLLRRFGSDNPALQRLGNLLVELDLPDRLAALRETAVRQGHSPFAFQVQMTALLLHRGKFDQAEFYLQGWEPIIAKLTPGQRHYPEFIRRLVGAAIGLGRAQTTLLLAHLNNLRGQATPQNFEFALRVLEQSRKLEDAAELATLAERTFPFSERLLAACAIAKENAATARSAAQTKPDSSAALFASVADADAALGAIDDDIRRSQFVSARERLNDVRNVRPAWLVDRERDVEFRTLQLNVLAEDAFESRAVVRRYLGNYRDVGETLRLVAFAGELRERRRPNEAQLVLNEVAIARGAQPEVAAALAQFGNNDVDQIAAGSLAAATSLLDEALDRRDPEEALRLAKAIRLRAPPWLNDGTFEIAAREFRARWATGEKPSGLIILRDLSLKNNRSRNVAFRLVRNLIAEGDRATAHALAKEIAGWLPGDRAALALLREAEPTPLPAP